MNRLHPIAQAVQSQGRGNDTQLVHMTPGEVQGLQALAKAHGGSLSINPETGLVEAGFLESILPTVAGFALNAAFPGLGTLGSAALVGLGATALNKGDIEKGLMAGLGAWGGAGMAESLLGQASKAAAANVAAQQSTKLAGAGAESILNPTMSYQAPLNAGGFGSTVAPASGVSAAQTGATNQFLSNAGLGGMPQASMSPLTPIPQISTPPMSTMEQLSAGAKSAMQSPGQFLKDNWQYAGAAAAPVAMDMMSLDGSGIPRDSEQFRYDYDPGRVSEADLAAQRAANPYGELTYFRPKYGPRQTVQVAQGGEIGYADGGIFGQAAGLFKDAMGGTQDYEYDPVTRTYTKKTSAPVGAVPSVGVPGSGGSSGGDRPVELTEEQKRFFEYEMPDERDARMGKIGGLLGLLAPGSIARALVGGLNNVTGGGVGDTRAPVSVSGGMTPNEISFAESGGYTADVPSADQGGYDPTSGYDTDTDMAKGGMLHYENGGPTGAVEPVGINNVRPMDQSYFKDMAVNTVKNAAISKIGQAMGLSPQAMALGMAAKGIYGFFNPDKPAAPVMTGSDFPSVPGQNPSGDSGGGGGGGFEAVTPGSQVETDYGGVWAKGGLLSLAAGGMSKGGFVIPADVVSALGNGSTDAGLRTLQTKLGAIKPIKGKGDGLSDSIPTSIDGKQPARVADGEAYIPPQTVAKIGGGNTSKGAKKLYAMMDRVRKQAHGKTTQQRKVSPKAVV